MQVEIEFSLFLNIILNFFIVKLTAKCVCEEEKFAFLSSFLGAIVALIMPIFNISQIANIFIQVLLSLAICFMVFPLNKKFLLTFCIFLGFAFLFGGACLAVQNIFGTLPLLCVLAIGIICYIVACIVIKHQNRLKRLRQFSFKVNLFNGSQVLEEEGFLDSGNVLYDPVTKKPIILINFDIFCKLQPDINYMTAYLKKVDTKKLHNGHYVKINTVASGTSILVFTIDKVEIIEGEETRRFDDMAVGLTFSGFEKSLGKNILLNRELA